MWLYGSAGVTETTRDALATQIADGDLVLYATHADDDFIAPVGRVPVSEHPVDPLTIPGVNEFRSNGGYVDGPGGGTEEWGERTEGHNSQRSTEFYYLFDGFELTPDGNPVPVWDDASGLSGSRLPVLQADRGGSGAGCRACGGGSAMNRDSCRAYRVAGTVLAAGAIVAVLSGCGGDVAKQDQVDAAREINSTFKTAVADVQLRILDGEWEVGEYGDIPIDCGDSGYAFRMDRTTPSAAWQLDQPATDTAEELGAWMNENGWTAIAVRTYDDPIDDVTLKAQNEAAGVAELTVNFLPGEHADTAIVRAETTCVAGDPNALTEELVPGWPTDPVSGITRPETERPDAAPLFGFTEDGSPR